MNNPMGAEVQELKVLRERAEALLGQAQAAVFAVGGSGRYRPGMARLCEDLGALRQSLDDLAKRQIAVALLWDDGYAAGRSEASADA